MCFAYYVAEAQKKGCQASLELETVSQLISGRFLRVSHGPRKTKARSGNGDNKARDSRCDLEAGIGLVTQLNPSHLFVATLTPCRTVEKKAEKWNCKNVDPLVICTPRRGPPGGLLACPIRGVPGMLGSPGSYPLAWDPGKGGRNRRRPIP